MENSNYKSMNGQLAKYFVGLFELNFLNRMSFTNRRKINFNSFNQEPFTFD